MTGLWIYAYVALPVLVVALGYLAMRANARSLRQGRQGPAE
ncbi:hypothetical protein [Methylobacterium sp. Leaf123]|nr:hypothetical protein [Methylobacterium sp. Leaf123]